MYLGELDKISFIQTSSQFYLTIKFGDNERIYIAFDPNSSNNSNTGELDYNEGHVVQYLTINYNEHNDKDEIIYRRPYGGTQIYKNIIEGEVIDYGYFQDSVSYEYTTPKYIGNAYINTGNNSVYYNYVEEEFVGKGTKTYLYNAYDGTKFNDLDSYYFWLNGLPLATAIYDKDGYLKSVTNNKYKVSEILSEPNDLPVLNNTNYWFSAAHESCKYDEYRDQIKFYEYYINIENAEEFFYNNAKPIEIYYNGKVETKINPMEAYQYNILSRENVVLPKEDWKLMYGGKVLLESQSQYIINDANLKTPSINHFITTDMGAPYKKTEYFYDNIAKSIHPTRIKSTDSQGNVNTQVIRRIVDMELTGVISEMKSENILSPIVEEQKLSNNQLLSEVVNIYNSSTYNNKKYFNVAEQKLHIPNGVVNVTNFPSTDDNLYSYGAGNYTTEKEIKYINAGNSYFPVTERGKGEISTSHHKNKDTSHPTLETNSYIYEYVNALTPILLTITESSLNETQRLYINELQDNKITKFVGNKVKLYIVSKGIAKVKCEITDSNGIHNSTITTTNNDKWNFQVMEINTSTYSNISSMKISSDYGYNAGNLASVVVVPEDCEFEAFAYNVDGTTFCKFNQNGQMERYEYDSAMRIIKQYNHLGDLVKSYEYHNSSF